MPSNPQPNGGAPAAVGMMSPQAPSGDSAKARIAVAGAVKILARAAASLPDPKLAAPIVQCVALLTEKFGPFDSSTGQQAGSEARAAQATMAGPGEPPGGPTQKPPVGAKPKTASPPQQQAA